MSFPCPVGYNLAEYLIKVMQKADATELARLCETFASNQVAAASASPRSVAENGNKRGEAGRAPLGVQFKLLLQREVWVELKKKCFLRAWVPFSKYNCKGVFGNARKQL